jgi:hypothetical protein
MAPRPARPASLPMLAALALLLGVAWLVATPTDRCVRFCAPHIPLVCTGTVVECTVTH